MQAETKTPGAGGAVDDVSEGRAAQADLVANSGTGLEQRMPPLNVLMQLLADFGFGHLLAKQASSNVLGSVGVFPATWQNDVCFCTHA